MPIVQETLSGATVIPFAGPPGVSVKGDPGPEGPASTVPGPPGPAGAGAIIARTASVTIPAWTAVVPDGAGYCRPADPSNPAHAGTVIGVSAEGAAAGAEVTIHAIGDAVGGAGGWNPGDTLYVGAGGALSSAPPISGWVLVAGKAVTVDRVVVGTVPLKTSGEQTYSLALGNITAGQASISLPYTPGFVRLSYSTPGGAELDITSSCVATNGTSITLPSGGFPGGTVVLTVRAETVGLGVLSLTQPSTDLGADLGAPGARFDKAFVAESYTQSVNAGGSPLVLTGADLTFNAQPVVHKGVFDYELQQPYTGATKVNINRITRLMALSPQMFGTSDFGVPDGVGGDHNTAFVNMFAAACGEKRDVHIGPGNWWFAGVDITAPISIRGAGRILTKIFLMGGAKRSAFRVMPLSDLPGTTHFDNVWFSDFELNGLGGYQYSSGTIENPNFDGVWSCGIDFITAPYVPPSGGMPAKLESRYSTAGQMSNLTIGSFLTHNLYIGGGRSTGSTDRLILKHSLLGAPLFSSGYDWRHDHLDISANSDDRLPCVIINAGGNNYFNFCNMYNGRNAVQVGQYVNAPCFFQNCYFDFCSREGLVVNGTGEPDQQVVVIGGRFYGNSLYAPNYFTGTMRNGRIMGTPGNPITQPNLFSAIKLTNTSHFTLLGSQIAYAEDDRTSYDQALLTGKIKHQIEFEGSCQPVIFTPQSLPYDAGPAPKLRPDVNGVTNDFTKLGFAGTRRSYIGPFIGENSLSVVVDGMEATRTDIYKFSVYKRASFADGIEWKVVNLADLQSPSGGHRPGLYTGTHAVLMLLGEGPVWTDGSSWRKFSDNTVVAS